MHSCGTFVKLLAAMAMVLSLGIDDAWADLAWKTTEKVDPITDKKEFTLYGPGEEWIIFFWCKEQDDFPKFTITAITNLPPNYIPSTSVPAHVRVDHEVPMGVDFEYKRYSKVVLLDAVFKRPVDVFTLLKQIDSSKERFVIKLDDSYRIGPVVPSSNAHGEVAKFLDGCGMKLPN